MSTMTQAVRTALSGLDPNSVPARQALYALQKARMALFDNERTAFYGAFCLTMELVPHMLFSQGTAATDGRAIYFNPTWINEQTHRQLIGLLWHETDHVLKGHTTRRKGRNPYKWNVACDHVVNNEARHEGLALPENGLCDPQYNGWAAEEVFAHQAKAEAEEAEKEAEQPITGCGGVPGKPEPDQQESEGGKGEPDKEDDADEGDADTEGEDADSEGEGEADTDADEGEGEGGAEEGEEGEGEGEADSETEGEAEKPLPAGGVLDSPDPITDNADIHVRIVQSARIAKAMGRLPGNIEKLVKELTRPDINFHELLAEFVTKSASEDYSFSRPNRRYISQGIYLPSLKSESTPEGAFFMDTSGSRYSDAQLKLTVGALDACIQQVQPERVHVMACDTEVRWSRVYERGEALEGVRTPGGGGTDFNPPFEALKEEGIEPAWCVYLTDGMGRWPTEEPPYPVLWIITTPWITAPWGVTVHLPEVRET